MKKRILPMLLAMLVCLALACPPAFAADSIKLKITVRDFKADGILFGGDAEPDTGMIGETLGADGRPVYNLGKWRSIYGSEIKLSDLTSFFSDAAGRNMKTEKTLDLYSDGSGYLVFDSSSGADGKTLDGFFPIDGELFGNERKAHNYHFSVELHTQFKYVSGATFEFSGDCDVWIFINKKLVIDLCGVHGERDAFVSMDKIAGKLGVKPGDTVSFDMFCIERRSDNSSMYIRTNFSFLNISASNWALPEIAKAADMNLIPDVLAGKDLKQPITRAEFAAIAVKVYESLSGTEASASDSNPFDDTSSDDVLKALNEDLMVGTSSSGFSPEKLLSREEAATALTRVYKRVSMPGWSLDEDNNFILPYEKPAPFEDDSKISSWAKDSVYFMASNGIIVGTGGNKFSPRATTTEEESANYAVATREQAICLAVRMVERLG